jgi:hypothetical protein
VGPNYLVTQVPTGGSYDNLRAVKHDEEGNMIGMTIEGLTIDKNDKQEIKTLVPLQWCYLHLVARVDSLTNLGFGPEFHWDGHKSRPITLSDLAGKYYWWSNDDAKAADDGAKTKNAKERANVGKTNNNQKLAKKPSKQLLRIYLGPAGSGTRQLAELVLRNVGINPAEVEPNLYIPNVEDVPEQLSRNNIDAAFVLEPPPSDIVSAIAAEGPQQYTLVSIDNANDLLPNHKCLVSAKIPPGTYSFLVPSNFDPPEANDHTTHLAEIESLATRRLIVASEKMSNSDAYYLANCIRAAIPHDQLSRADKDGHWLGPDPSADLRDHPLTYDPHPGVDLNPDSTPAFNWLGRNLTWIGPLLLAMSVSLVTELKNRVPSWLDRHRMDTHSPAAYAELETQLEALHSELLEAYDGSERLSDLDANAFSERLGVLTCQIRPLRRAGQLSRNEVEALHQIAFKAVQLIDSIHREPPMPPMKSITNANTSASDQAIVGPVEIVAD